MKEYAEGTLPTRRWLASEIHNMLDTELSPRSLEFQSAAVTTLPRCWAAGHSLLPRLRATTVCSRLSEMIKCNFTRSDNKVREPATGCLSWQQWTEASVWFDDVGISLFHSCVVVDLWQSLSLSVLVCRHENVGAWIRALWGSF
jgi:hypothetical protein